MSLILADLGEIDSALYYSEKSYKLLYALNPSSKELVINFSNMGLIYHNKKDYDMAISIQEIAIQDGVKLFGLKHPVVADILNHLGLSYFSAGFIAFPINSIAPVSLC